MKKLLLIATAMTGAYAASAQGLISFNNSVSAATHISINTTPGSAVSAQTPATAGAFYYELFYSTSATSDAGAGLIPTASTIPTYVTSDSSFVDSQAQSTAPAEAQSSASLGRVTGSTAQVINGVAAGNAANFVIIGWSANIGSTVSALEAYLANPVSLGAGVYGYVGESLVANMTAGNGSSVPTPTALNASNIPGFALGAIQPTPEPTTIALGVMGACSLLALRRKKA